jgi:hypothetical protein
MLQECFSTAIKQGDKYILNGSKTQSNKMVYIQMNCCCKKKQIQQINIKESAFLVVDRSKRNYSKQN